MLWCDDICVVALATNLVFHARTKHIELDYHLVRVKVINHDIIVKYISAEDQMADIFTKGHASARFVYLWSIRCAFLLDV